MISVQGARSVRSNKHFSSRELYLDTRRGPLLLVWRKVSSVSFWEMARTGFGAVGHGIEQPVCSLRFIYRAKCWIDEAFPGVKGRLKSTLVGCIQGPERTASEYALGSPSASTWSTDTISAQSFSQISRAIIARTRVARVEVVQRRVRVLTQGQVLER